MVKQTVGLGFSWHGDGRGPTLNVRLRSPPSVSQALAEHYTIVDCSGGRNSILGAISSYPDAKSEVGVPVVRDLQVCFRGVVHR